jgi:hypothetical protein
VIAEPGFWQPTHKELQANTNTPTRTMAHNHPAERKEKKRKGTKKGQKKTPEWSLNGAHKPENAYLPTALNPTQTRKPCTSPQAPRRIDTQQRPDYSVLPRSQVQLKMRSLQN